jgi:dTDP-4-amino-4,6-dideoxygalactose transaminase
VLPEGAESSWNYMVLLVSDAEAPFSRDQLFHGLKKKGIQTKRYFYPPVHRLSVYRRQSGDDGPRLPVTESVSAQALALPLFTHMEEETVQAVCDAVHSLC